MSQCVSWAGPTVTAKCRVSTVYAGGVAASAGTSASGAVAKVAAMVSWVVRRMRELRESWGLPTGFAAGGRNSCSGELELRPDGPPFEVEEDPFALHAAAVAGQRTVGPDRP